MPRKVAIHITETINHTLIIDLDEMDEEVEKRLEAEDGEFFGDWTSMVTAKDGSYEFDSFDEVTST